MATKIIMYTIFDEVNEGQFEFQVTEAVFWVSQIIDFKNKC